MFLRFLNSPRIALSDADTPPAGGAPPAHDGPPPAADPKLEAKLEAARKEAEKLRLKVDAADKADAERKKAADEAKRKAALDDGKAKDLLSDAEAKLAAKEEESARLRDILTARAARQVEKLPESERDRLTRYRDRVEPGVWLEMVDDAVEAAGNITGAPPAPPAPGNPGGRAGDKNVLGPEAAEYLEARTYTGRNETVAELANQMVTRVDGALGEDGATIGRKFVIGIRKQLGVRGASRRPVRFDDKK